MISYTEIIDLYGTPISKIPAPQLPFKLKTSHIIIGVIVLGLAGYGFYKLTQSIPKQKPVTQKESNKL